MIHSFTQAFSITVEHLLSVRRQAVCWAGAPKQPKHTAGVLRASASRGPQGSALQLDLPPSLPSLGLLLSSWLLTSGVIIKWPFSLHFQGLSTLCRQHSCLSKTQSWDKAPGHGMQVLAGASYVSATGIHSLLLRLNFLFASAVPLSTQVPLPNAPFSLLSTWWTSVISEDFL